jgi:hypothetical protein
VTFEVEVAGGILLSFRGQNLLNTDLINEVFAFLSVRCGPLLIVGQMRADALCHHHNKRPIIHVQRITAPNKLIVGVACERAIGLTTKGQVDKSGSCITVPGVGFDQIPL